MIKRYNFILNLHLGTLPFQICRYLAPVMENLTFILCLVDEKLRENDMKSGGKNKIQIQISPKLNIKNTPTYQEPTLYRMQKKAK